MGSCRACGGSGKVPGGRASETLGGFWYKDCAACNGTGTGPSGPGCPYGCLTLVLVPLFSLLLASCAGWSFATSNALDGVNVNAPARGAWTSDGGCPMSPAGTPSRLDLNTQLSGDYLMRVQAERRDGNGPLVLGLVVEGRQFALVIDDDTHFVGVQVVEGQGVVTHGVTRPEPVFAPNQNTVVVVEVTGYRAGETVSVKVTVGTSQVFTWSGPRDQLGVSPDLATPNTTTLFVGSPQTTFKVNEVRCGSSATLQWVIGVGAVVLCVIGFSVFRRRR